MLQRDERTLRFELNRQGQVRKQSTTKESRMNQFTLPTRSLDPCSIGPLTCGPINCEAATHDDENITLFSAAARKGRMNGSFRGPIPRSSTMVSNTSLSPLDQLKERVSDFQSRGWLSQQEHRKYMALLDTAPPSGGREAGMIDHVQKELIKELDLLEDKMTGGTASFAKQIRKEVLTPKLGAIARSNSEQQHKPLGNVTNQLPKSQIIVEASDLAHKLSKESIQDLFVETCFYARLGFVQPPCCLQCTYMESQKDATPDPDCNRWVVWRRDARHVLHPETLEENTIFVQCHAARDLLAGKVVDGHKWEGSKKVLLFPPLRKTFLA